MTLVWRRSKNKGSVLLIELAIADHANDAGSSAFPSIPRLAHYARQTDRNVQFILQKLTASKEVLMTSGGPKGTHQFRINIPLLRKQPDQISRGEKFAPVKNSARGVKNPAAGVKSSAAGVKNRANYRVKPASPDPDPSLDPSSGSVNDPSSPEPRKKNRDTVERFAQLMMMNFGIDELVALELAAMHHVDEEYLEYWIVHADRHSERMVKDETLKALGPGFFVKHIRAKNLPAPIAAKYREAERDRIHAQAGDRAYFETKKARRLANKRQPQKPWWEPQENE